jgi:hypothetical protein
VAEQHLAQMEDRYRGLLEGLRIELTGIRPAA